jgi:hypothetical protein
MPVNVGLICGVTRETSGELEQPAIGNRVLAIVTVGVLRIDLPFQPAITTARVPTVYLVVEAVFCQCQSLRL